ncbi:MAG: type I-U CRISPR-associated protein Cas5/Cas6 [Actinobacteria bacterium]|nr:type I-U CRISPR-associated protein Cas5/Cas6 [Actinomycetota bacterium]
MFGLRVVYLRGSVTAADVRGGQGKEEVEWPPHPDRLFCALVQAWGDLGEPEDGEKALRWLEELQPPNVTCGEILCPSVLRLYVPVNDTIGLGEKRENKKKTEKNGGEESANDVSKSKIKAVPIQGTALLRVRQKRHIPSAPLEQDEVFFWWPDVVIPKAFRGVMERLVGAVASLGHSSSLVFIEVIDEDLALEPSWVKHPSGTVALRVPYKGRLEELCKAYRSDPRRRPPQSKLWATYGRPAMEKRSFRGQHDKVYVFRLIGERPPLPLECTAALIERWRSALVAEADQPPNCVITGHAPDSDFNDPKPMKGPFMALFPLPDVGHRYARSHIMGLAAALPEGISREQREECLIALGRVRELNMGRLGKWSLIPCDVTEKAVALHEDTWRKQAKVWASVTPFVFGRYPKDLWGEEAVQMVREACLLAGLPEPVEVATAPISWILGSPPSFRFPPLPTKKGRARRCFAHVRLAFAEPVSGPVLVGAGRHRGYGIFRQLPEESHET